MCIIKIDFIANVELITQILNEMWPERTEQGTEMKVGERTSPDGNINSQVNNIKLINSSYIGKYRKSPLDTKSSVLDRRTKE